MGAKTRGNYPVSICLRKEKCYNADKCKQCFKHKLYREKK